jgi:DNA-binding NtrC family response regulator
MKNQSLPYDVFFETLRENELDALKAYPVLVVCGDVECSDKMVASVRKRGLEVACCSRVEDARSLLSRRRFSLVFTSDILPDGELRSVIEFAGTMPVIVFSRRAEWDAYLDALNQGAFDYIACPPGPAETERILELALHEPAR